MSTWLMKSEPTEYSIDDLKWDISSSWYGVRNYQARNYMRDSMQIGDRVLFYHSNCKVPGIAWLAEVVSLPHPDMTQFIPGDKHYDPKSTHEKVIWQCVDVGFVEKFSDIVSLADIRMTPWLENMKLLQRWSRLSITPVTEEEYAEIYSLSRGTR